MTGTKEKELTTSHKLTLGGKKEKKRKEMVLISKRHEKQQKKKEKNRDFRFISFLLRFFITDKFYCFMS